jgi:hypothetical protein
MSDQKFQEELLRLLVDTDRRKLARALARVVREEERRREQLDRVRSFDRG